MDLRGWTQYALGEKEEREHKWMVPTRKTEQGTESTV